jgi:hypothetical protein
MVGAYFYVAVDVAVDVVIKYECRVLWRLAEKVR